MIHSTGPMKVPPQISRSMLGKDSLMGPKFDWTWLDGPMGVSFPAGANQSDITLRTLQPVLMTNWETGAIAVEQVMEVQGTVPRTNETEACVQEEVCHCGGFRCQGPDFKRH